jgi:hypothetical protein
MQAVQFPIFQVADLVRFHHPGERCMRIGKIVRVYLSVPDYYDVLTDGQVALMHASELHVFISFTPQDAPYTCVNNRGMLI